MEVRRIALNAGEETAFEFDKYYTNSVVVKNETSDVVMFCEGIFNSAKAAHIPAYTWQSFNLTTPIGGGKAVFYVKSAAAGNVEINFGSSGMGVIGSYLDVAGMIPHKLSLSDAEGVTTTASLIRVHGETLDLDTPVPLTTGATVFSGDVVTFTVTVGAGFVAVLKINGEEITLAEGSATYVISGETVAEGSAVEEVIP